jgi:hypothetical protein
MLFNRPMKKYLLTLLCLLALRLQATPAEPTEPIGQRLGLSLLEVLDSIQKEGVYHYTGSSGKPSSPEAAVHVYFQDNTGNHVLTYSLIKDKCDLAMMMLPLTELDATVRHYDQLFPSIGKQMWRTPYGRVKVSVFIGAESMRNDHKPHLCVIFDPLS